MTLRILLIFAGIAATGWAFARWRRAFEVVMVLLVLEGAIRKWLVPGAQDLVYLAKDALLLGVYAGFWSSPARLALGRLVPPGLTAALAASAGFGALQIFNPNLPNVLVGILGFKAYFLYLPMLWVVPAVFAGDRELAAFLKRMIWLSIAVNLLAVIQFRSPASSVVNTYARASGPGFSITTFGSSSQVRVTGTFSYISGYSSYVLTMAILILAVLATTRWRFKRNLFTFAALGLTILGMLMSGSRGPVFSLVILLPLYGWLSLARGRGGGRTMVQFLLGAGLIAALVNATGSEALSAFYGRAAGASDAASRITTPLIAPLHAFESGGLLGSGIGSTHQTAAAVTPGLIPYSWLKGANIESEPGQVMLELGLFGFVLVHILRIALIVFAFKSVLALKTTFHQALATSALLFFLAHLLGGVVFNVTAGVYYGFFAGLVTFCRRCERLAPA